MPKYTKHYATEARTALARLIDAKAEAAQKSREAQARAERLSALTTAAAPIAAKLAAIESAESAAFAEWSKDPAGRGPISG